METATESGKIVGEEELAGVWNIEYRIWYVGRLR